MATIQPNDGVTETTIESVAYQLYKGRSEAEIRERLLTRGLSEYMIFLTIAAGKVHNLMFDKEYVSVDEKDNFES